MAQLARAKEVLNVLEDQEVAQALGLTKAALSLRKSRGAFPVEKLLQLIPERLSMTDLVYIKTGARTESERRALQAPFMEFSAPGNRQVRHGRQAVSTQSGEGLVQLVSAERWDALFEGGPGARVPLVAWALYRDAVGQRIRGVIVSSATGFGYCDEQPAFLCYLPRDAPHPSEVLDSPPATPHGNRRGRRSL